HTTSNCCHGMALLARDLIFSTLKLDLKALIQLSEQKIEAIEMGVISDFQAFTAWVPQPLVALTGLYILTCVRDMDDERMRTEARKLRIIYHVGATFCWEITNALQKHFSKLGAHSYKLYLQDIHPTANVSGVPISMWGSYIEKDHIRIDKRGIHYV